VARNRAVLLVGGYVITEQSSDYDVVELLLPTPVLRSLIALRQAPDVV
jgi:hypothetical protein